MDIDPLSICPFVVDWQFRVVICLECHFACVGQEIATHLHHADHVKRSLRQRQNIASAIQKLPILQTQSDLQGFSFPLPTDVAHPQLQEPKNDGLACRSCGYISRHIQQMQSHQRTDHGWINPRDRGRSSVASTLLDQQPLPWRTNVACQRFFRSRAASHWFEVTPVIPSVSTAGISVDALVESYNNQTREEDANRYRIADGSSRSLDYESVWVRQMGWARHLNGIDTKAEFALSALPKSDSNRQKLADGPIRVMELRLSRLTASLEREIARGCRRIDAVPNEVLRWLAGIDPSKPAGKPFSVKEEVSTVQFYTNSWKRYLCYLARLWPLGRAEFESIHYIQFTDSQWSVWNRAMIALDDWDENIRGDNGAIQPLDRRVSRFCIVSLIHKLPGDIYRNPLVHFMAILGIDPISGGWQPATRYTRYLAGILWGSRVLFLEYCFAKAPLELDALENSHLDAFLQEYRNWLVDGSNSPISVIIRQMAYGKGFRRREGGVGKILWDDDRIAFRFVGQRIEVEEFKTAAVQCSQDAAACLDQLCFGARTDVFETIPLSRIDDTLLFEGPGRSFSTNPHNDWLRPGPGRLAVLGRTDLFDEQTGQWKIIQIDDWLTLLYRFRRLLLVATHIWSGQPGRGPEVMSMRYCDTQQQLRNVFVFDGQVLLITDRDKNRAIRGIGRKVARFLPDSIGRLMVAYIAWVLPFERMLQHFRQQQSTGNTKTDRARADHYAIDSSWLWKDGWDGHRWDTPILTTELSAITARYIGVPLKVSDYRHVVIELGRHIQGLIVRQQEIRIGADDDDKYDSDDSTTGRSQSKVEYIWDLQATHGSAIARRHYAVHVQYPDQLGPDMVYNFREISRLWHSYLENRQAEKNTISKRPNIEVETADKDDVLIRCQPNTTAITKRQRLDHQHIPINTSISTITWRENSTLIDTGLRTIFGPTAVWRSLELRQAMEQVMAIRDQQALLVILPTGIGKSLLFMIPTMADRFSTDIVVVPFVRLLDDLVRRARLAQIPCFVWQPEAIFDRYQPDYQARLIFISADMVNNKQFLIYVDTLRARKALRRIFIEECHTLITDIDYRQNLGALSTLYRFDYPLVFLTATLPPSFEPAFREAMLAVKDLEVIRATTVKSNIRYTVQVTKPGRQAIESATIQAVADLGQKMQQNQKGIIYCRTRAETESLSKQIGCDYYHSDCDKAEGQAVIRLWLDNESTMRWIVATSGLGVGIDIGGITAVIHAGLPYGITDFVQQTGRAARQIGETAISLLIHDGQSPWTNLVRSDIVQANSRAMELFANTISCRRVTLGTFMDGQGRSCTDIDALPCDRCNITVQRPDVGSIPARNRLKQFEKDKQAVWDTWTIWLGAVQGRCGVCYIRWHRAGRPYTLRKRFEHTPDQCRIVPVTDLVTWRRSGLRFSQYICCWRCGLPQDICPGIGKSIPDNVPSSLVCLWADQVLRVVLAAYQSDTYWPLIQTRFDLGTFIDKKGEDGLKAYALWAGRTRRFYGQEYTNALAVWDFIIREYCI